MKLTIVANNGRILIAALCHECGRMVQREADQRLSGVYASLAMGVTVTADFPAVLICADCVTESNEIAQSYAREKS